MSSILGPFECLPCDGMVLKAAGDTHELDCLQGVCNQSARIIPFFRHGVYFGHQEAIGL